MPCLRLEALVCRLTLKPLSSSAAVASSVVMLTTSGTSTFSRPLETLRMTSLSFSTSVSAAGSVSITVPLASSSSNSLTTLTFRPRLVSAAVAAFSVWELSSGIFTLPLTTGSPGELEEQVSHADEGADDQQRDQDPRRGLDRRVAAALLLPPPAAPATPAFLRAVLVRRDGGGALGGRTAGARAAAHGPGGRAVVVGHRHRLGVHRHAGHRPLDVGPHLRRRSGSGAPGPWPSP